MPSSSRPTAEAVEISTAQKERLAYLEIKVFFCGILRRADLESRFGIGSAAATRDLAVYRELAPDNLQYDHNQRVYQPGAVFQAVFPFNSERILSWLLQGFGDGLNGPRKSIPCEGPNNLVAPDLHQLAAITRAIHAGKAIKADYLSLSTGPSQRELVPLALADNGLRWHLRAYDRNKNAFQDYVLTRLCNVEMLESKSSEAEQLAADEQWQRIVDLELVPHPAIQWQQAVAADYGMVDGRLRLKIRAALAGYALRRWAVDCTPDARLSALEHHLWLNNPQTLYGVRSASLAPGYQPGGPV
ncbi:WYL domain-containing protein [Aquitalea sp. USM4]|uniref:WYL domain-containing protein n=1 Tax=Aquitalea sp. USM4 TaxID=1590041 RepID=UPI001F606555|nr:WYL domain-containing protein [Aquitalea sp. USM4]